MIYRIVEGKGKRKFAYPVKNREELMALREQSRQKKGESPAKSNIGELLGQMMQLELAGAVVSLSGGRYRLA